MPLGRLCRDFSSTCSADFPEQTQNIDKLYAYEADVVGGTDSSSQMTSCIYRAYVTYHSVHAQNSDKYMQTTKLMAALVLAGYVKYGYPIAVSTAMLAWGFIEFPNVSHTQHLRLNLNLSFVCVCTG